MLEDGGSQLLVNIIDESFTSNGCTAGVNVYSIASGKLIKQASEHYFEPATVAERMPGKPESCQAEIKYSLNYTPGSSSIFITAQINRAGLAEFMGCPDSVREKTPYLYVDYKWVNNRFKKGPVWEMPKPEPIPALLPVPVSQ